MKAQFENIASRLFPCPPVFLRVFRTSDFVFFRVFLYSSVFFVLLTFFASAQKQDYQWLMGYKSFYGYDTTFNKYLGISRLDFNQSPRNIYYDSLYMNFSKTNTSMCDSEGNLLFYTNGINIANSYHEKIENSDSLNPSAFQYDWDPDIQTGGYRSNQGLMAFESRKNSGLFYLLHILVDTSAQHQIMAKKLLFTVLDMKANNGHGKVLVKNKVMLEDTIEFRLNACRHANGNDWWILFPKMYSPFSYYSLLLTDTGIALPAFKLMAQGEYIGATATAPVFSPDGKKYAFYSILNNAVFVYDFNRCTGQISKPTRLPITGASDSGWYGLGTAFSPSSRFLYVGLTQYVFQYDMQAADIAASRDTVAVYDGHQAPFGSYFHTMQLGPDGKIYESCGNSEWVLHVIECAEQALLFRRQCDERHAALWRALR